jgi:hypothetical protein
MSEIEEFKKRLQEILKPKTELAPQTGAHGVVMMQEEGDDIDAQLDQLDKETKADGDTENTDSTEGDQDTQDTQDTENQEDTNTGDQEEPQQEPENNQPEQPQNKNDQQKVQEMFKDTGAPDVDYSLGNENNVRLYKFKFTYAGVDVNDLMKNDEEKRIGLTRKELESRLSPEQLHYYKDKWKTLREKFPQIPQREKNVAIHNANIMLSINNKEGEEIPLPEDKRLQAYKKINAMLEKKFGTEWQDLPEALNFLKNIKINFSDERPVKNNLLSVKVLAEKDGVTDKPLIPFNKIYVETPASVQGFLRMSQESDLYNGSSIYQSLSSDFKESDRTKGTMDAIIKGDAEEQEETSNTDGESSDDGSGGGGGGGMGGDTGGDEGTPDLLDLGGEDTGDAGGDTGGDTGEDTGGDTTDDTSL